MAHATGSDALIGRQIGAHVVVAPVGRGGMGVVYLADDRRLARRVALKVLAPELAADDAFRARFLRETKLAAALEHPHIVPVHDAGEADGLLYMAMRYVEGADLRALLNGTDPPGAEDLLGLMAQVAAALDAAHARGLVHRDVKPRNILVGRDRHAYLADFGVSYELDGAAPAAAGPGAMTGTLAYMAPERIEGAPADAAADRYALACVLFECLTGEAPFALRTSELALLWAHLEEDPPAVSALAPSLPDALDDVLRRGLAKDPADRFETCGALVEAARAALSGGGGPALPPALDLTTPLLGRDADLAWLREHWRQARTGRGRVVLVSGPRGAGKTRLSAEVAWEAHGSGATIRHETCVGGAGAALRALDAAMSSQAACVLVLDDLDAAGGDLLAALAHAAGDAAAGRALIVGTTRDTSDEVLGRLSRRVHHRALGPLDTEAIRAIAGLYAGDRGAPDAEGADALTIRRLAEASGGVPLRVHELAAEWARAETARRLGRNVAAAQARRSALEDAETALAEDALEFQLARERALLYFPELARKQAARTTRAPFKGLEAFSFDDADDFFGRERLVGQLVARLAGATFLGLVGPSGSGKSSALRAGLLPALAGGVLPGSERWRQHVVRPGADPCEAIDRVPPLDGLGKGERLLLVVDQLEEVFTSSAGAAAHAFAQRLVALARDGRQRAVVVVAVRADFYGRCAEIADLGALLSPAHVLVGPVGPEELRRAIERPAERAGLTVEPELTEAFIRDVADAPGTLPLVSTALLELWETRRGRVLRLEDYERMGGVHGAVARLAEGAWSALTPDQRPVARGILLRLAGDGEGDGAVRRRVPLTEFDADGDPRVAGALATLTGRRVVAADGDGMELAHEALLREWPRLRAWLEDDAAGRAVGRRLAKAASDWDRSGRDAGELYRGARLAGALDWSARHPDELNELEREFVARSRAAAEAETRRFQRTNRRLRALVLGVAALLAAAVAVGTLAFLQRERARDAERRELGQRLGAQALAADALDRAVLLGRQALEFDDSVTTRGALLGALLKGPAALRVMRGDGDRLLRLAAGRANVVAVADNDGTVVLLDARSFRPLGRPLQFRGQVSAFDVSADGRRLAVSYAEGHGALEVVDLRTRRAMVRRQVGPRFASSLWFSRDGRTLLVALTAFGTAPNRVELVDVRTGRTWRRRELPVGLLGAGWAGRDRVLAAWRNPRAAGDGAAALLDARTLAVRRRYPRGHDLFVVDRAGRRALFLGEPGISEPEVVQLGSGRARTLPLANPAISGATFSPDGKRVLTVGERGSITVQDAATLATVEVLEGHSGTAFGPVFAPDGETFFTAGLDSSIIAWDLAGSRRLGRPFSYATDRAADPGQVRLDPAFSPDGRSVAVPTPGGRLALLDARGMRPHRPPLDLGVMAMQAAYSRDGTAILAATSAGELRILDARTGRERTRRRYGKRIGGPGAVALRPDGRVVAAGGDAVVALLDARSALPVRAPLRIARPVSGLAYVRGGPDLAVARIDGVLEMWDTRSGRRRWSVVADADGLLAVDVSPDGRLVATGGLDGTLRFFHVATGRPRGTPVPAHAGFTLATRFAPDGRVVATSGTDGAASLWDVRTGQRVGAPLPVGEGGAYAAYAPGGASLVAVAHDGRGAVWDIDPAAWRRRACAVAGRVLTREEWRAVLPNRPYRPACGPAPEPAGR